MFYRAFVYKQTNFVKKHTNVKERFYWVAEINLIVFACVILFVMARLIYRLPNYGYSLAHTTLSRKINVIHSLSSYKFSQKLKTNHYLEAQVYESFDLFDILHFGLHDKITYLQKGISSFILFHNITWKMNHARIRNAKKWHTIFMLSSKNNQEQVVRLNTNFRGSRFEEIVNP